MESIWVKAKASIKERVPGHSYRMWIEPLQIQSFQADQVVLSTPNFFSKKRVQNHYGPLIESEVRQAFGVPCSVTLEVTPQVNVNKVKKNEPLQPSQKPLPSVNVQPHAGRMLRRNFTFDHFVVGGNNDFAYSASLSLASQQLSHQNTLLLVSNPGMGKSHLSQAVGHHILGQVAFPHTGIRY